MLFGYFGRKFRGLALQDTSDATSTNYDMLSLSPFRSFSGPPTDASSHEASTGSTPPTSITDDASIHSDASKQDVIMVASDIPNIVTVSLADVPSPPRPRRAREQPVYNLAKLSGTAGHGKRQSKGDVVSIRHRRRTIPGTLVDQSEGISNDSPINSNKTDTSTPSGNTVDALDLSAPRLRKKVSPLSPKTSKATASRRTSARFVPQPPAASPRTSTKRNRQSHPKLATGIARELSRLQDTNEFAHVDDRPVLHTIWANGKYVDPNEPAPEPARKKMKVAEVEQEVPKEKEQKQEEPITRNREKQVKKYLIKGLYAGQEIPKDVTKGLTIAEKKQYAQLPQLDSTTTSNKTMPPPIFTGLRTLIAGRDFKLPFQVCNPLPPGQPKPDEWKRMTKNRFIGDSKEIWRKTPHFHDFSKCVCTPDGGCGDNCQNRIMLYECDATNCNIGKERCANRAFANLTARRAKGGKYRVGVEVIKTSDRGHGVRSNRCFRPNQIIMEYAGEIITEDECDRRMREVYKDNDCYYLMSFDQNMIIDATTGSIARFVNHSCNPNCRMIKWIVSGQPRMALFAGDKPIMTGDELTYDYNFDPFSAKNVQGCLCGEANCRGVLGPRPREVKQPKIDVQASSTTMTKSGKRKLSQLFGNAQDLGAKDPKKRKIRPVTSVKQALSKVRLAASKTAASIVKKRVSKVSVATKKTTVTAKSPSKKRVTSTSVLKKTTARQIAKVHTKAVKSKTVISKTVKSRQAKANTKLVKAFSSTPKGGQTKTKLVQAKHSMTISTRVTGTPPPRDSPLRKRTPTKKAAAAAAEIAAQLAAKPNATPPVKGGIRQYLVKQSPKKNRKISLASEIMVALV